MISQILFLEILLVVLINQPCNLIAVPNLSLCPSPVRNQNCILQCSESNVSLPVTFEHPSGKEQGSCLVPGNNFLCDSANYTTYQSLPITYLNISSLDKNRDNGEWRCLHGSSSSETITLYVSSPQRTQEIPQVTTTETEIKITCAMLCQYPTTTISVELLYAEEGTNNYTPFPSTPTLTIDSADSSGCESYESNYKAKFTFTKLDDLSTILGKNMTSKCNFTQSIIQTSEDTGTASALFVFQFKDVETTTITNVETTTTMRPSEEELSTVAIVGIVIAAVACFLTISGIIAFCVCKNKGPLGFSLAEKGRKSVKVKWKRGFNGGHAQTFVIRYTNTDSRAAKEITIEDTDHNPSYTQVIDGLTPNTTYHFWIYSTNKKGDSTLSDKLVVQTLKGTTGDNEDFNLADTTSATSKSDVVINVDKNNSLNTIAKAAAQPIRSGILPPLNTTNQHNLTPVDTTQENNHTQDNTTKQKKNKRQKQSNTEDKTENEPEKTENQVETTGEKKRKKKNKKTERR